MKNSQSYDDLIEDAYLLIAEGRLEEARAMAQELVNNRVEAGFEILASISMADSDIDGAISHLEQGIDLLPDAFRLWLQKGEFLASAGRFEDADDALNEAMATRDSVPDMVKLARGHLLFLQEKIDDALNVLQEIEHPEYYLDALLEQVFILDTVGQYQMLMEIAQEETADLEEPETEEEALILSEIFAYIAKAAYQLDHPEEEVQSYLDLSLDLDRSNEMALWLIREQHISFSDHAKVYFLEVVGKIADPQAVHKEFQTSYQVVADSVEEALGYIRQFEGNLIDPKSLKVIDQEVQSNPEDLSKGIYETAEFQIPD